jgi:hypothetical protein
MSAFANSGSAKNVGAIAWTAVAISKLAIPMKQTTEVSPFKGVTSIDFFRRAQQYRLSAAVTDKQHDVEVFIELAVMFDEIAYTFQRIETKRRSASATANSAGTNKSKHLERPLVRSSIP